MRLQLLFIFMMCIATSFELVSATCTFKYTETQNQNSNFPFCSYDISSEQENDITNFSMINYKSESLSKNNIWNLADKILLENGDVICILDILSNDDIYDLIIALNKHYAHFLYIEPTERLNSQDSECSKGFLIVSKLAIKQRNFTFFKNGQINEGFLDFVIENKNVDLGHIYVTNLGNANSEEKIGQIKEKMESDIAKNETNFMPFILFGALNNSSLSSESKTVLEKYFSPNEEGSNCILLVKDVLFSKPQPVTRDAYSLLFQDPRGWNQKSFSHLQQTNQLNTEEFRILTCSDHHYNDQDQQSGVEGGVKGRCDWGGKDGVEFSGSAYTEVHDSHGNYTRVEVERKSNGHGSAEISAGHKTDKKDPK